MMRTRRLEAGLCFIGVMLVLVSASPTYAQLATVSGFVSDASDGRPMELVNVVLADEAGVVAGAVTNRDGLYALRVPPARYVMHVSFIGYETYTDTLALAAGEIQTLNVVLHPREAALGEVLVESERTSGAARVTGGLQIIRPADIEQIPSPDVTGDLAGYLVTLPGVVATADRGGQLFIRGGEPAQNLVQVDGMLLYQPFHLLGFYSAFPADILGRVDVYAGGFGSKFGERISSVIDVATREGNKRRFAGAVSLSPFVSGVRVEGPILPRRVSLLASLRQAVVEDGAERLIDERLPFAFGDAFAKVHAEIGPRSRLSLSTLLTYDRGTLTEDTGGVPPEEIRWWNRAAGIRYLLLPRKLPVMGDVHLSYSQLESELGPPGEPVRRSSVDNIHLAIDATFFGRQADTEAGLAVRFISLDSHLGGLYQNVEVRNQGLGHFALYVEPEFVAGRGLRIRPGLRLQFFNVRLDPLLEPRLRLVWDRGIHQLSGAAGVYHQEIVGLSDRRDAASIFTVWTHVPRPESRSASDIRTGRIPRAVHTIVGYRVAPARAWAVALEGFYKDLANLFVAEWTAVPRLSTRLQPASGRTVGFDVRLEVHRRRLSGYLTYGFSSTRYTAEQASLRLWYGEERLRFRPPHDRRHQLNLVAATSVYGLDVHLHWAFGSGLPFSRAVGFDGFVLVDDIVNVANVSSTRRVIYERPFNATLPAYHRLDVSLARTFAVGSARLSVQGSLINVYDRRNLFYLDVFTLQRVDQLPLIPSLGLRVEVP